MQTSAADALAGFGLLVSLLLFGFALWMVIFAILVPYRVGKIRDSNDLILNNLWDVNARLDVVVPKLIAWLNRQEASLPAPPAAPSDLVIR